jgi:hypothetical protein
MIFIIFLEIFKFNKYIGIWGYGVVNFGFTTVLIMKGVKVRCDLNKEITIIIIFMNFIC